MVPHPAVFQPGKSSSKHQQGSGFASTEAAGVSSRSPWVSPLFSFDRGPSISHSQGSNALRAAWVQLARVIGATSGSWARSACSLTEINFFSGAIRRRRGRWRDALTTRVTSSSRAKCCSRKASSAIGPPPPRPAGHARESPSRARLPRARSRWGSHLHCCWDAALLARDLAVALARGETASGRQLNPPAPPWKPTRSPSRGRFSSGASRFAHAFLGRKKTPFRLGRRATELLAETRAPTSASVSPPCSR